MKTISFKQRQSVTHGVGIFKLLAFALTLGTQYPLLTHAQVAIGDSIKTPDPSAVMELFSQTKGFLPPRMTTVQRDSIASPADGLIVYDTDLERLMFYHTAWKSITLWNPSDTNVYFNSGSVAIGPGSESSTYRAELLIAGTRGIVSDIAPHPDSIYPTHIFSDRLINFSEPEFYHTNFLVNTEKSGDEEGSVTGLFSYNQGNAQNMVAIGAEAFYEGTSEELPSVVGSLTSAYVENSNAAAFAVGAVGSAESDHAGINIGIQGKAMSDETSVNIGTLAMVNDTSDLGFLGIILDSIYPTRFTAGAVTFNQNTTTSDFNLFAAGGAKSYFEGNVGVGTLTPTSKLDVEGTVKALDFSIDGLPLIKTGGAIDLGDSALVGNLKITEGSCENCVLTSDPQGMATWEMPLIYHKSVSFSSSQILSLSNSNPLTLVSAPGSGKVIVPLKVFFRYTFVTTAYSGTGVAADRAEIKLRNASHGMFFKGTNSFKATASCSYEISPLIPDVNNTLLVDNDDLVLSNSTIFSPTTGDGTLKVEVFYMIVPY